ncbi:MAG: hypothetical protein AAGA06_02465 [Pseudomonadota bacterium]
MNLFDEMLPGRQVTQVCFVHDYLQVVFGDMCLTINSRYEFIGAEGKDFIDEIVEKTLTSDDAFTLVFSQGRKLKVGIANEDYHSPEAMVLSSEEIPMIVWN